MRRGISLLVDSHSTLIIEHRKTENNTDQDECIDNLRRNYRMIFFGVPTNNHPFYIGHI